jgi:hypothetical protein
MTTVPTHQAAWEAQPFVTFAGAWAEAMRTISTLPFF